MYPVSSQIVNILTVKYLISTKLMKIK